MSEKKKALAVLWSPKSLLDFLWYYEAYGKTQYEYDVLVLTAGADENGKWKTRIYDYVVNAKIFNNISVYKESYVDQSLIKKLKVVTKMAWYAIRGKQKEYCVTELMPWIDYRKYNQIVTVFLPTIFSGELVTLSETLEVVLLEDGVKDYVKHRKWPTIKSIKEMGLQTEMAGLFLSKMGYADPTTSYDFKPTRNCVKFSSMPQKLLYREYKMVKQLNDMSLVDEKTYSTLVEQTFSYDITGLKADCVFFTAPLNEDFKIDKSVAYDFAKYIAKKMGKGTLLLKKHPRDEMVYEFPKEIEVIEVPQNVPAELLLEKLDNVEVYFAFSSTFMKEIRNLNPKILFDASKANKMYNTEKIWNDMKTLELGRENLIDITEEKVKDGI